MEEAEAEVVVAVEAVEADAPEAVASMYEVPSSSLSRGRSGGQGE